MSDEPKRRTDSWHFEKRLSLDTIVAILGVTLALGVPLWKWASVMESRVIVLEAHDEQRSKNDVSREADARDQRIAVLSKMEKLDEQVTQLRIEVGKLINQRPVDGPAVVRGR